MQNASEDSERPNEDLDALVFLERLALYYDSLIPSLSATVLNALLLAFVLRESAQPEVLIGWLLATLSVAAVRMLDWSRFRRYRHSVLIGRHWYRRVLLGTVASGLCWGAAGLLLFSPDELFEQGILTFVIAGMSAGSIASLTTFLAPSLAFIALTVLPFAARLLAEGSTGALQMGIMAILFTLFMSVLARRIHHTVVRGLQMTHLRQRAEQTISRQAYFDALTQLPNRRLLKDRLIQARSRARRADTRVGLLFLDLDHFKRINDSLGHTVGDQLLILVAQRLLRVLRIEDTAARLGGDEFIILLTDLRGTDTEVAQAVNATAERLRESLSAAFLVGETEVHISASIGVSLLQEDTEDVDDLLKHADTAMYSAKDDGRNSVRFFVQSMNDAITQRLDLERRLREALDNNALDLYIQPQFDRDTGLFGGEALLRWNTSEGAISPAQFIPVAEESGLIYRIGDWVVQTACAFIAEIQRECPESGLEQLSVNVSPRQFRRGGFTEQIVDNLERHGVKPHMLELEVTETALIEDIEDTRAKMALLRQHGVRFSIDDFGTGYSSLTHLKQLPIDALKIDQSFVLGLTTDTSDQTIVRAIITLAATLGLEAIAEGVESESIYQQLCTLGCRRFQGYALGRPMPRAQFLELLRSPARHGMTGTPTGTAS